MSCDEACLLFRGLCYCRSKCCSTAKTYINQIAMIAGAVTTKQTVLEVLDLPLFSNAEMQGDNSLGTLSWGNLFIRKAEDQL